VIPIINHKNGAIYINQTPLIESLIEKTYLTEDMAVGTAVKVKSTKGFHAATNQPIIIGSLGNETSEIVESETTTSPDTITLASTSIFAHKTGDPVYLIKYNQIEISHSATAGGSKSVLATVDIQPDKLIFIYDETAQTTGYYFARFKETVGGTFSDYTDAIPYSGWASNTVGYIMDKALKRNTTELSDILTKETIYSEINECMRLIQGKLIRWAQHSKLNAVIDQTSRGSFIYSLPTDIYDNDSNKSVIGVRIGDNQNLSYLDPVEFEERLGDLKYTQATTEATAGDTTFEIDNSYDFSDTGSVNVYISGTKYNITYTGITRSETAGVLTGVPASGTGAITVTIPVDTYVYQDEEEGEPDSFTIRNNQLEIYQKPDASYDNMNIYMDYWKVATEVNSDGDIIDIQRFDMILDYLTWKIKAIVKNDGELNLKDGYYLQFRERLSDTIRTSRSGLIFKMSPKINTIRYNGKGRTRPLAGEGD